MRRGWKEAPEVIHLKGEGEWAHYENSNTISAWYEVSTGCSVLSQMLQRQSTNRSSFSWQSFTPCNALSKTVYKRWQHLQTASIHCLPPALKSNMSKHKLEIVVLSSESSPKKWKFKTPRQGELRLGNNYPQTRGWLTFTWGQNNLPLFIHDSSVKCI